MCGAGRWSTYSQLPSGVRRLKSGRNVKFGEWIISEVESLACWIWRCPRATSSRCSRTKWRTLGREFGRFKNCFEVWIVAAMNPAGHILVLEVASKKEWLGNSSEKKKIVVEYGVAQAATESEHGEGTGDRGLDVRLI